jgi:hypothetical protein
MSLLEPLPKNSLWSKECLGWKYINNRVAKEESHLLNSWHKKSQYATITCIKETN